LTFPSVQRIALSSPFAEKSLEEGHEVVVVEVDLEVLAVEPGAGLAVDGRLEDAPEFSGVRPYCSGWRPYRPSPTVDA
jgi:hypothetical protein